MPKLIADISMSLDGFVAGPDPTLEDPLGAGGEQLHEWAYPLAALAGAARPLRRRGRARSPSWWRSRCERQAPS